MILTSTSDIIRIVTSSTADIHVQAGWVDITTSAFTPGRTNTVVTSATTTTIVASPASSTQRQVKTLYLYNAHASTSNTITIQHYDGTTSVNVHKHTLAAGESVEYTGQQFLVYDSAGTLLYTVALPTTITSAQLSTSLTDETGTGVVVYSTSPALTNPTANNFISGYTSTATAAGTTTLTVSSNRVQIFTGSTTQTVVLPVVSTLVLGTCFEIINLSSGVVTVQSSGANTIQAMAANTFLKLYSNATTGTGATVWYYSYLDAASDITGTGSLVRATSPTLVTPTIGAASATSLTFSSTSGIIGTTTNNAAAAGSVGEVVNSAVAVTTVSLTSATNADVTNISLTAGDWLVFGNVGFFGGSTTTVNVLEGWTNSVATTKPATQFYSAVVNQPAETSFLQAPISFYVPIQRYSLASTTTIYLGVVTAFGTSTCTGGGSITGLRIR